MEVLEDVVVPKSIIGTELIAHLYLGSIRTLTTVAGEDVTDLFGSAEMGQIAAFVRTTREHHETGT